MIDIRFVQVSKNGIFGQEPSAFQVYLTTFSSIYLRCTSTGLAFEHPNRVPRSIMSL